MYCTNCGKHIDIEDGDKYCCFCGQELNPDQIRKSIQKKSEEEQLQDKNCEINDNILNSKSRKRHYIRNGIIIVTVVFAIVIGVIRLVDLRKYPVEVTNNTISVNHAIKDDTKLTGEKVESNAVSEFEVETTTVSNAYESYLKDIQETYPSAVSHAVQNYVVNAQATMSSGEIPSNSNMVYVIDDEFRYNSELEFQWEYAALKYSDCDIVPVDKNYVYSFILEDYLLDYWINEDYDMENETYSGIVFFQYRIVEECNQDNVVVKEDNITVCLEFTVKYSEERQHHRLIELKYLSSYNECDKYADCEIVGHDWESEYKCDTVCVRCGIVKGECVPGVEATCVDGQYCTICHKNLKESLGHEYSDATCDAPAKCLRCGYVDPANDGLGHVWIYTEDNETLICSNCGTYYCSITSGTSWHNIVDDYCVWCGTHW